MIFGLNSIKLLTMTARELINVSREQINVSRDCYLTNNPTLKWRQEHFVPRVVPFVLCSGPWARYGGFFTF